MQIRRALTVIELAGTFAVLAIVVAISFGGLRSFVSYQDDQQAKSYLSTVANLERRYASMNDGYTSNPTDLQGIPTGITVTSSGFYGPQGRSLRLASKMPDIHLALEKFKGNGKQIVNFEMESSAIFALGKALGHQCTSICLGVANRPQEIFSTGIDTAMDELITYVLERI
jgi:uridine phosphorylase